MTKHYTKVIEEVDGHWGTIHRLTVNKNNYRYIRDTALADIETLKTLVLDAYKRVEELENKNV